jgi:hypothetical protein
VQAVNAGIARGANPTATLAAFGLAHQLVLWIGCAFAAMEPAGLVLVSSHAAHRQVLWILLGAGAAAAAALLALAWTPLGTCFLEGVHRAPPDTAAAAR